MIKYRKMTIKRVQIAGVLLGLIITFITLFADHIGLDNNPIWGIKRYLILLAGIFMVTAFLPYRGGSLIDLAVRTSKGRFYSVVVVLNVTIVLIYAWFASTGYWTNWFNETYYYDLLATSFRHGQIALEVQPDPALLALEEPYEPENREGIPVLWDATFYNGKYYLYWGPAPALLLAFLKFFYSPGIGDKTLTFLFLSGTLIFLTLLILELWREHFSEIPKWMVLLTIAFAGLVNPMPYILVEGRIYEAAIIAGQFFFLGGLYSLVCAFNRPSALRFVLAGLFLALSVGSRTTLAPAVTFIALIVFVRAVKSRQKSDVSLLLAFAAPLALGFIGYAWYNVARFGSITEFGLRHQLTSYNLYKQLDETFSPKYIPPNLYKTFFNPLERRQAFPYIFPTRWSGPAWLGENLPQFYLLLAESVTGILIGSPFVLFAILAGFGIKKQFQWTLAVIAGSAFLSFLTLQMFFFTAMRYMLDFIPALSILAAIGFWQGSMLLTRRPLARKLYGIFAGALFVFSITMSLLLSVSGNLESFKVLNPDLLKNWTWLANSLMNR
jgi:hypothetical protein